MRYYFDLRDGDEIITDDEGLELNGIDRVQEEAACSLADMAKDAARSHRTDGTKYAPAFAALNPSLGQVYFDIASASIIANALAN